MRNSRFEELLQLYMTDKLTAAGLREFLELVKEGNYDESLKETIAAMLDSGSSHMKLSPENAAVLKQKILLSEKQAAAIIAKNRSHVPVFLKIATAAAVIAAFTWFFWPTPVHRASSKAPIAFKPAGKPSADQPQYIHLSDGSLVLLNRNSRLEYPDTFDKDRREVTLIGEAYFDIQHVPSKPFIVHTKDVSTTVLGTAFNIKAYPENKEVTVTVTRGKVKVRNKSTELGVLTPNNELSVNVLTNTYNRRTVNVEDKVKWKNDYLIIEDLPFKDAAIMIQQKFHVNIVFGNEALKQCRLTAIFLNGESLHDVLEVVTGVLNATYTLQPNDQIIVNGEGCL